MIKHSSTCINIFLFYNSQFSSSDITCEIKEGVTYESGVGLSSSDHLDEEIPDCTPFPVSSSLPQNNDTCNNFDYFDLEKTGLVMKLFLELITKFLLICKLVSHLFNFYEAYNKHYKFVHVF